MLHVVVAKLAIVVELVVQEFAIALEDAEFSMAVESADVDRVSFVINAVLH